MLKNDKTMFKNCLRERERESENLNNKQSST